jgi:hypothetical protein
MQKVMKIQNIEKLWNSEEVNNFILNSLKQENLLDTFERSTHLLE